MCSTDDQNSRPIPSWSTDSRESGGGLPSWLKIVLIIVVWGLLAMWWVIVFFSIKARLNSESDEDDEW